MNFSIRSLSGPADFPALVELLNKVWTQPVTVEILQEWENRRIPGQFRQRFVADIPDIGLSAYGLVFHSASSEPGRFFLEVIVDPDYRHLGIGSRLYDQVLAAALAQGAQILDCEVRDNCPACLRFAQKRGFVIARHLYDSVLTLTEFDFGRFAPLISNLEEQGIRIFSLATGGDTEALRRELYAVNRQGSLDDPASKGTFPSYEEFSEIVFRASWFNPEGQILAADGDKVIGLSAVGYFAENNSTRNMTTSVLPPYRGRKIAQTLKAAALKYAQSTGAEIIRTQNDSTNMPILAVNRKLGYQAQPGEYRLVFRRAGGLGQKMGAISDCESEKNAFAIGILESEADRKKPQKN